MSNDYHSYEDDPTLTAYALGELDGEEAQQVEARLADDPAARAYVDSLRHTADRLTKALHAEPEPAGTSAIGSRRPSRWPVALAAAAAIAALGLSTWSLMDQSRRSVEEPTIALAHESSQPVTAARGGAAEDTTTSPTMPAPATIPNRQKVERQLMTDNFQQALAEAKEATARGESIEAQAALQRATAARNQNPLVFQNEELAQMDRQLRDVRQAVTRDEAAYQEREQERETASRMAAERAVAEQTARQAATERLQQDLAAATAVGDADAAARLTEQLGAIAPDAQAPQQVQTPATRAPASPADALGGYFARPEEGVHLHNDNFALPRHRDRHGGEHLDDLLPGRYRQDFNTEQYDRITDNPFKRVAEHPLSTFSVDVDTASYSNVRRFLTNGQLPPPDAVRIEELVNYFDYDYSGPENEPVRGRPHPFAARVEVAAAPWNPQHRLVRIGIKGEEVAVDERSPANLVFLLDVSGSMDQPNKLPLVKESMNLLVRRLHQQTHTRGDAAGPGESRPADRIAIVVYAGATGLVLPSTPVTDLPAIEAAIGRLDAGGSTNGGAGIELAYKTAEQHFIKDGINRVILCTDGDFNIGITNRGQLTRLIEEQAKSGVYLSVLGFGMGNLKDATMEELTNKGEGNYAYIDTGHEARKVLVEQLSGTLQSIAKDVKIQVEFNPAEVASYRLIGYENRILAKEDFNDDTKDAGDIGAGHEVTALYEVVPADVAPKEMEEQIASLREEKARLEDVLSRLGELTPEAQAEIRQRLEAIEKEIEALGKLPEAAPPVDELKYQEKPAPAAAAATSGEMLTVKLRYKAPDAPKEQGTSTLIEFPVKDQGTTFDAADADFQHAAAVAGFGMLLRDSPYKGSLTWEALEKMTQHLDAIRELNPRQERRLEHERRLEFRDLVLQAKSLATNMDK